MKKLTEQQEIKYNRFIQILKIRGFIILKQQIKIQFKTQEQMMQKKCDFKTSTKIEEDYKELSWFQSELNPTGDSRQGKWSDQENLKFAIFVHENSDIFKSKQKRKAERIFINLATFIESRSPRQCRSHFQKVMKKFATIVKLKNFYKNLIGAKQFQTRTYELMPRMKIINQELRRKQSKVVQRVEAGVQTEPMYNEEMNRWIIPGIQNMCWYFPTFS